MNGRAALFVLLFGGLLGACGESAEESSIDLEEDLRRVESELLLQALESPDQERQRRAALAMGRIQSPAYAAALARRTQRDEAAEVRIDSFFALGQLGLAEGAEAPDAAVDACIAGLEDPDPDIVAAAVQALGKLATTPEVLTPYLRHSSSKVRTEAASALFRHRFVPVWRRLADTPRELPAESVQALAEALGDPDASVRRAAAHAFSRYGQAKAAGALVAVLDDEDEWVRLFAVRALGRSQFSQKATSLLSLLRVPALILDRLEDASPRVRTEAVTTLAALGAMEDVASRLARDESFHVRAALARGLARSESPESLQTLERLQQDASSTVRGAALEALAQRRGANYGPTLAVHLQADEWPLRVAAARALGHLGPAAPELLRSALADSDNRVRAAAVEALGTLGEGGSREPEALLGDLQEALSASDLAVRGAAVAVLAQLPGSGARQKRLQAVYEASGGEEWIEIRESLVDALATEAGAAEFLRRIQSQDPAPSVRSRAHLVLRKRGAAPAPVSGALMEPGPEQASPYLGHSFEQDPTVVLETTKGDIEIRCLARQAPIHVANFVELVKDGFYDGLVWHRVVSNFVVQGGDPRGDGWGGPGYTLRDEINPVPYNRGAVGMPKAGKDTGGCQIFITHVPTPHLDGNYTVLGQVTAGLEVVDEIEVGDEIRRAYVRLP